MTGHLLLATALLTSPNDTTTIYSLIGRDTVAVEQFVRSPTRLEGILVSRVPRTAVSHYAAELGADGRITKVRVEPLRPDRTPVAPVRYQEVTFARDSLEFRGVRGDSVTTRRLAAPPGVVPFVHPFWSYGFYDQALRQAVRTSGDSIPIVFYQIGSSAVAPITLVREGSDGLRMTWRGVGTIHFRHGPAGEFLGDNSLETTFKTVAAVGPNVDILNLASQYAARDTGGSGLGALSPRDTARAVIGGAVLTIEFSRPSMRGRTIFGGLVPYGEVWRAGADAATTLTVDHDLLIGATLVAAGAYTLWIIPSERGDTLLINGQTGQWGTQHDPGRDLFRLPLLRSTLAAPNERYTIGIERSADGGAIHFEWESRRLTLAFRVP